MKTLWWVLLPDGICNYVELGWFSTEAAAKAAFTKTLAADYRELCHLVNDDDKHEHVTSYAATHDCETLCFAPHE